MLLSVFFPSSLSDWAEEVDAKWHQHRLVERRWVGGRSKGRLDLPASISGGWRQRRSRGCFKWHIVSNKEPKTGIQDIQKESLVSVSEKMFCRLLHCWLVSQGKSRGQDFLEPNGAKNEKIHKQKQSQTRPCVNSQGPVPAFLPSVVLAPQLIPPL